MIPRIDERPERVPLPFGLAAKKLLEDLDLFIIGPVDQSVVIVDPARPVAGKVPLERLRLADAAEWLSVPEHET